MAIDVFDCPEAASVPTISGITIVGDTIVPAVAMRNSVAEASKAMQAFPMGMQGPEIPILNIAVPTLFGVTEPFVTAQQRNANQARLATIGPFDRPPVVLTNAAVPTLFSFTEPPPIQTWRLLLQAKAATLDARGNVAPIRRPIHPCTALWSRRC